MNKLFTKNNLWYFIAAILAVHMLNVPFVIKPYLTDKGPTWYGLDVSWQMVLNYALSHHWVYGKDIIYTYGPLGVLATRIAKDVPAVYFLLFDFFVVVNFFFVFKDFIADSPNKVVATLTLFVFTVLMNISYGGDISWVLLFFTCYWLFKTYKKPHFSYFLVICFLTVLSFYIKLNTALVGFSFLFVHLVVLYLSKIIELKKAALVAVTFSIFFALSLAWFNISLAGYIKNALEIVKGYNDIMYLKEEHHLLEKALFIVFFLILAVYALYGFLLIKSRKYPLLFYSAIGVIYVFLLQKQCTLRNDVQHLSVFFSTAPLILLCGNLLFDDKVKKPISLATFLIILFSLFSSNHFSEIRERLRNRYSVVSEYSRELLQYNPAIYSSQKDKRYIPARVLEKINRNSIDIFPWDCEYLIENNLYYTPRPLFQSFVAYTDKLEQINYDFFEKQAPRYIIYDYNAIDNRYPFNDEPLVNMYLIKNYTIADTFTSNERWRILLQKKETAIGIQLRKVNEEERKITDEIPVDKFSYVKIYIRYSLRGKVHNIYSSTPELSILYSKQNNEWSDFKTSSELLKSGMYVDRYINTNKDFASVFSATDTLPHVDKIKLFINDTRYFEPKMKVEYFTLSK